MSASHIPDISAQRIRIARAWSQSAMIPRGKRAHSVEAAPAAKRQKTKKTDNADIDVNPQDSIRFDTRGLMQTTSKARTVFSLVQGPTHLRKNAHVYQEMIRRDPTTQTAFGIGSTSSVMAFLGFTIDIAGIDMVAPYRNRDVIARDANTELFTSLSRGTKNVVHSVCASVALSETSVHYEKHVYIKARERIVPKPDLGDVRDMGGVDEDSNSDNDDDDEEYLSPVDEEEEDDDDGTVKNVLGKEKKTATKPPPLLLYKATNLVLMNTALAARVWRAVDKMAPGLVKYAEQERIKTRYYTSADDRFAPRRIDCCGVLNDILLTMQEHSLQHPPDSAKGKMLNWTIELIARPELVSGMVPQEAIEFGHTLDKITYTFGRSRSE